MDGLTLQALAEGVISILLTLITYFLSNISQEMKQFKKDYGELRNICNWLLAEQAALRSKVEGITKSGKTRAPKPD